VYILSDGGKCLLSFFYLGGPAFIYAIVGTGQLPEQSREQVDGFQVSGVVSGDGGGEWIVTHSGIVADVFLLKALG
jgi:hypothetical protein